MPDTQPKEPPKERNLAKETWTHDDFKLYIIDAALKLPISLSRMPREIILDKDDNSPSMGTISNELQVKTQADPRKREHFRIGVITLEKKLVFHPTVIGTETNVQTMVNLEGVILRTLKGNYTDKEIAALSIHTHGVADTPPSPKDFTRIITEQTVGHEVAFIVVTNSSRFLIMRSLETPDFSQQEAMQIAEKALAQMKIAQQFMNITEQYQAQMKFVLDTCREYRLGLYVATDKNKYKRITV